MSLLSRLSSAWGFAAPRLPTCLQSAGLLCLLLAGGFALHAVSFAGHRTRAVGVVTENVASFAPGGGIVYAPRVRFRAADGTTRQPILGPAADEPDFAPGATVPVLYLAGKPESAVIATTLRLYAAAIWFGVCGVILLDAGLLLKRFSRRPPASGSPSVHR